MTLTNRLHFRDRYIGRSWMNIITIRYETSSPPTSVKSRSRDPIRNYRRAHLGVVDREHNSVLLRASVAWHGARVRSRCVAARLLNRPACGSCTPPRTGPLSEGEAGHREIRVARPLHPAAPKQTAQCWPLARKRKSTRRTHPSDKPKITDSHTYPIDL